MFFRPSTVRGKFTGMKFSVHKLLSKVSGKHVCIKRAKTADMQCNRQTLGYEAYEGRLDTPFLHGFGMFCPVPKQNRVASSPVPLLCGLCSFGHSATVQGASRASRPRLHGAETEVKAPSLLYVRWRLES